MENIYSVADALDLSKEVYHAEDIQNTEVGEFLDKASINDLVLARIPISSAQDATKRVQSHTDKNIASDVEKNGTFRIGDTVFHTSKPYKYKMIDLPRFFTWLLGDLTTEQIDMLCAVVGPTFTPKLRALDSISSMRGKNSQTIRDTFIAREYGDDSKLQMINLNSSTAPKWALNMEEGERFEKS
tara:strand:- start:61 stop:615 length:555 start_codon:yes stop_codon:yes gene_type:complete